MSTGLSTGWIASIFIRALKHIYYNHGRTEGGISKSNYALTWVICSIPSSLSGNHFLQVADPGRTSKHVADLNKGASGKRINMFLRWMVRRDEQGVDFGIWKDIPMHALYIPLDVHTGNVARKLGLLTRNQNDWKAVDGTDRPSEGV